MTSGYRKKMVPRAGPGVQRKKPNEISGNATELADLLYHRSVVIVDRKSLDRRSV
jgi:phosphoribosyl-ATP pyrophosphohydrolase